MGAGRGRGESTPRDREAVDVGEVERFVADSGAGRFRRRDLGPLLLALEAGPQLVEPPRRADGHPGYEGGLGGVRLWNDHLTAARAAEGVYEDEGAGHRPDGAVEAELADHTDTLDGGLGQLARCDDDPESDGELEAGSRLANRGRREIDGDPLHRPLERRREDRRPGPFARLADCGVGEADDAVRREPGRDVNLHGDDLAVEAEQGCAQDRCEHGGTSRETDASGGP